MEIKKREALMEYINNVPLHRFLGFNVKSFGEGRSVIEMPVSPNIIGVYNVVHAGVFYTMCEVASAIASATALPENKLAVTFDINISVLKPVSQGNLLIEAWVLKLGKRTCFMEVRITDDTGEPAAAGRVSNMIVSKPGTA